MKTLLLSLSTALVSLFFLSSCSNLESNITPKDNSASVAKISASVASQIQSLGFNSSNAVAIPEGYLVEGDIVLTTEDLEKGVLLYDKSAPQEEQYRTTQLVTGLPRVITIKLATTLPQIYISATDEMIKRYNALGLRLTFKRITSGTPTINIVKDESLPNGTLATSGFPYSYGSPYGYIKVKTATFGNTTNVGYVASTLAHEMGHCIGFRHTDYFARVCDKINEKAGDQGAVLIPGTPSSIDYSSWMISCGGVANVPFSIMDVMSLRALYK